MDHTDLRDGSNPPRDELENRYPGPMLVIGRLTSPAAARAACLLAFAPVLACRPASATGAPSNADQADISKARVLELCKSGDADACSRLGIVVQPPPGSSQSAVATEPPLPAPVLPLSGIAADTAARCERGSPHECFAVGRMLEKGESAPADRSAAAVYYGKGCNGGDSDSCRGLVALYDGGLEVPSRGPTTAELLDRGCALDDAQSCERAARLTEASDLVKAVEYHQRACKLGFTPSCERAASIVDEANIAINNWFCWHGAVGSAPIGYCHSSKDVCMQSRARADEWVDSATDCNPQKNAACISADSAMEGERVTWCYVSLAACNQGRRLTLKEAKKSRDYTHIGKCTVTSRASDSEGDKSGDERKTGDRGAAPPSG